jgi:TetR/AcrR family transcriptional repressor of nem operon
VTKPNTREQIIQAALESLLAKSFNAVGVQDITEAAGVPKGSFYNHFESKEALGAEIVTRYGDRGREILAETSTPPLDRLRRHFERLIARFADAKFERGCMLGNFSAELSNQSDMIRDSLGAVYKRWTADIAAAIAEAQKTGAIKNKTKADEVAAYLLDSFEGALLRARVEKSRSPFDRFMDVAFSKILT